MTLHQAASPRTVYVAGRIGDEERVSTFLKKLREAGFYTRVDWTTLSVQKPYLDHPQQSAKAASKMLDAACSADIFVLLWNDSLLGGLLETGAALAMSQQLPERRIYIVGTDRESVFYALPAIRMVDSLHDVLLDLRIS
jgi:hypothetical protein